MQDCVSISILFPFIYLWILVLITSESLSIIKKTLHKYDEKLFVQGDKLIQVTDARWKIPHQTIIRQQSA